LDAQTSRFHGRIRARRPSDLKARNKAADVDSIMFRGPVPALAVALIAALAPSRAGAIPVFARIYGKPCAACHTVFPQLNPDGERFRAKGLHGLTPAIRPMRAAPELAVPGTLPLAVSVAAGGDFIKVDVPGQRAPITKRFNLEYVAVLAGAELGPHLAFLGDYAPLYTNPRTGDLITNTRAGLAFCRRTTSAGDGSATRASVSSSSRSGRRPASIVCRSRDTSLTASTRSRCSGDRLPDAPAASRPSGRRRRSTSPPPSSASS
jgi:hypothetical protein